MWRNEKEKKKKICTEVQLLLLLFVFAYSVLNQIGSVLDSNCCCFVFASCSSVLNSWVPTVFILFLNSNCFFVLLLLLLTPLSNFQLLQFCFEAFRFSIVKVPSRAFYCSLLSVVAHWVFFSGFEVCIGRGVGCLDLLSHCLELMGQREAVCSPPF